MDQKEEAKAWGKGRGVRRPRWSDLETVFNKRWGEPLSSVAEPNVNVIAELMRGMKAGKK